MNEQEILQNLDKIIEGATLTRPQHLHMINSIAHLKERLDKLAAIEKKEADDQAMAEKIASELVEHGKQSMNGTKPKEEPAPLPIAAKAKGNAKLKSVQPKASA